MWPRLSSSEIDWKFMIISLRIVSRLLKGLSRSVSKKFSTTSAAPTDSLQQTNSATASAFVAATALCSLHAPAQRYRDLSFPHPHTYSPKIFYQLNSPTSVQHVALVSQHDPGLLPCALEEQCIWLSRSLIKFTQRCRHWPNCPDHCG